MKALYFCDTHIKGCNPINRKGSYKEDSIQKFTEVCNLSRELGCDIVIHGGDLFDSSQIAYNICDDIKELIESTGIDWYIVQGNHDELNHNPNSLKQTVLGHIFRRCPNAHPLNKNGVVIDGVYIQGFDYYNGIEQDIIQKGVLCNAWSHPGKRIAVVHAFLMNGSLPFLHADINKIPESNFDLVLVGHYHVEVGTVKKGNTTYVWPGSIGRTAMNKSNIERTPKVVFIDTEKPVLRMIPLQSAKPASEIFYLEKMEAKSEHDSNIDDFINSLQGAKEQSLNLTMVIQDIITQNNIDPKISKLILDRIQEVGCAGL